MNSPSLYIEISQTYFRALSAGGGLDVALERVEDGRLSPSCRAQLASALGTFLNRKNWQPRIRAWCAIGARGVSLRRMILPTSAKDELRRVIELQIESEFPLGPTELAWGYRKIGAAENGAGAAHQEILVMAIRKTAIQEYCEILEAAGVDPVFTVAPLARAGLCAQPPLGYAVLDVGNEFSELAVFEQGAPVALRVFPGRAGLTRDAIAGCLGRSAQKVYVTGEPIPAAATGGHEVLEFQAGPGRSAATVGMQAIAKRNALLPIPLQLSAAEPAETTIRPGPWKWVALAAVLTVGLIMAPYVIALAAKPHLERKLSAIQSDRGRLAIIDNDLGFLEHLKRSQPPYMEALYLIANSAAQGSKLESINMSRNGDVSLRGSMRDGQQVNEFRTKLIGSGFFTNVVVEEQIPTPDRQKVMIRITTQWKPLEAREGLDTGPKVEPEKKPGSDGKTNNPALNGTQTNSPGKTNAAGSTNAAPIAGVSNAPTSAAAKEAK